MMFFWIRLYVWIRRLEGQKIRRSAASPVPGLAHKACQQEAQAVTNEGEDGPDDPEGGGDDPGGLVQDPAHHGDDDDQSEACDGADLQGHK